MASQLNLYRRHANTCPHRDKGQNYTKCSCPIWCDGERGGKRFRRAVGVRDWARAVKRVAKWEESSGEASKEQSITGAIVSLREACVTAGSPRW